MDDSEVCHSGGLEDGSFRYQQARERLSSLLWPARDFLLLEYLVARETSLLHSLCPVCVYDYESTILVPVERMRARGTMAVFSHR